jgi:hypothetical protein
MDNPIGIESGSSSDILLFRGLNGEVVIPHSPKIPPKEGLHIQVRGFHDETDMPRNTLVRFLFAEAVAKAIAESEVTGSDLWANTRIEGKGEVNIYGRVPWEETSWRKPVGLTEGQINSLQDFSSYYDSKKLKRFFSSYMPGWEKLANIMTLFDNGINGVDSEVTLGNVLTTPVWTNGKFKVEIMQQEDVLTKPWLHINGFHLVVSPVKEYQRQWQTLIESTSDVKQQAMIQQYIQSSLEGAAIALGIRHLLGQDIGEIHNSGNWAVGLDTTFNNPEKGRIYVDALSVDPKAEKRMHFQREELDASGKPKVLTESDLHTKTHFHVYIPFDGKPVDLPSMWPWEAQTKKDLALRQGQSIEQYDTIIERWKAIKPLTEEQIHKVVDAIGGGKLTSWLANNCQGKLK